MVALHFSPPTADITDWDILKLLPPNSNTVREALEDQLHRLEHLPVTIPEADYATILENIACICDSAITHGLHHDPLRSIKFTLRQILDTAEFLYPRVPFNGSADAINLTLLNLRHLYASVY